MTIARLLGGLAGASYLTPVPEPQAFDDGDLGRVVARVADRISDVYLLDSYYRGDHRIGFATRHWRTEFGRLVKALNANYCPRVVDSMTDRLRLASIDIFRNGNPDPDANQIIIDAFRDNRFDRRAGMMHALAARHGEAYLLVWPHPDTGRPAYYPHTADRMVVEWDESRPGELVWAAKVWMEGRRCRVTIYYPEHVERWVTRSAAYNGIPTSAKGFIPYDEDGEGSVYTHSYGRVPVVPFLNNTVDGMLGRSELIDVLPIQDTLNKALADMFVAMEYAGFPQRWATGLLTDERDPVTGQPIYPFQGGVERLFTSDSPDTTFGQFATADLNQFVAVQDSLRSDIARVSGTPLHYLLLSGSFPSGEALWVADSPMRSKVNDRQDDYGVSWEDVGLLTLLVAGAASPTSIAEWTAEAAWLDTSPEGPLARAEYAGAVRELGASESEGFRILGWDTAKIEAIRQEKAEEGLNDFDAGGEGDTEAVNAIAGGPEA